MAHLLAYARKKAHLLAYARPRKRGGEVVGEGMRALGRQPDRKKQERRAGRRKGGGWGEGKEKGDPAHQAEDEGGRVPDLRGLTGDLGSSTREQETL